MTANLPLPSTDENVSTTLSTGITDIAGSMDVADASKIASPCYLVIDRVDSAGNLKDTSYWEYIKVTNVSSNTLTITRAQGGSTGQAHSAGAVVEAVATSTMFEDWYAALNPEHTSAGGHVIVGTMTVAGMNLASVATIARLNSGVAGLTTIVNTSLAVSSIASIGRVASPWVDAGAGVFASTASVNVLYVTTHINASGASLSGFSTSGTRPAFKATMGGNQTIAASNWVKVAFSNEIFDTNTNYDAATNYRFLPTVAGKYQVTIGLRYDNPAAGKLFYASVVKNGTTGNSAEAATGIVAQGTTAEDVLTSTIVDLNGSTDYVEAYAYSDGTTPRVGDLDNESFFVGCKID